MILCRIHKKMYIISLGKKGNFDKDEAKVPRLLKIDVFSELSPDFGHRLSLFFINVTFKYFQYTLVIFVTYFFILTKRKDFFFTTNIPFVIIGSLFYLIDYSIFILLIGNDSHQVLSGTCLRLPDGH